MNATDDSLTVAFKGLNDAVRGLGKAAEKPPKGLAERKHQLALLQAEARDIRRRVGDLREDVEADRDDGHGRH